MLLTTVVSLHDVADVEAFVNGCLNDFTRGRPGRPGVNLSAQERDELVAEGLAIMYDLASRFRSRLEGYEQDGRFSGFAAFYLPKKLGDAWHKLHEEHRQAIDPTTGKRVWVYHDKHCSYEQVVAAGSRQGDECRVIETNVRHLRDFAPVAVPARARSHDALAPADRAALAA